MPAMRNRFLIGIDRRGSTSSDMHRKFDEPTLFDCCSFCAGKVRSDERKRECFAWLEWCYVQSPRIAYLLTTRCRYLSEVVRWMFSGLDRDVDCPTRPGLSSRFVLR